MTSPDPYCPSQPTSTTFSDQSIANAAERRLKVFADVFTGAARIFIFDKNQVSPPVPRAAEERLEKHPQRLDRNSWSTALDLDVKLRSIRPAPKCATLKVDFKNAFNSLVRRPVLLAVHEHAAHFYAYAWPTPLVSADHRVELAFGC